MIGHRETEGGSEYVGGARGSGGGSGVWRRESYVFWGLPRSSCCVCSREVVWFGPTAIDEARGRRDAAEILGEPKPEVESES